jgi:hypothetical protein
MTDMIHKLLAQRDVTKMGHKISMYAPERPSTTDDALRVNSVKTSPRLTKNNNPPIKFSRFLFNFIAFRAMITGNLMVQAISFDERGIFVYYT